MVRSLPRAEKHIIELLYYQGLDTQQAAEVARLSVNKVNELRLRALVLLRREVEL